jgi:hypothetical protein
LVLKKNFLLPLESMGWLLLFRLGKKVTLNK